MHLTFVVRFFVASILMHRYMSHFPKFERALSHRTVVSFNKRDRVSTIRYSGGCTHWTEQICKKEKSVWSQAPLSLSLSNSLAAVKDEDIGAQMRGGHGRHARVVERCTTRRCSPFSHLGEQSGKWTKRTISTSDSPVTAVTAAGGRRALTRTSRPGARTKRTTRHS